MNNADESLWTPQTIVAFVGMAIVAGTVAAVLWFGDPQTRSQTVGGVLGFGSAIIGFYFGSSRGSQAKDAAARQTPAPGATP